MDKPSSGGLRDWDSAYSQYRGRGEGKKSLRLTKAWSRTMAERYKKLDELGLMEQPCINTSLSEFLRDSETLLKPFRNEALVFPSLQPTEEGGVLPTLRGKSMTVQDFLDYAHKIAEHYPGADFAVTVRPSLAIIFNGNILVNDDRSLYAEFTAGGGTITRNGSKADYTAWTPPFQEKFLRFSTADAYVRQSIYNAVQALPRIEEDGVESYLPGYYEVAIGILPSSGLQKVSFFDYEGGSAFRMAPG